jgi:L-asparaginase II
MHAAGHVERGLGVATKIADGSRRALGPAAIAALAEARVLGPAERAALATVGDGAIRNVAGLSVGAIRGVVRLRWAAA